MTLKPWQPDKFWVIAGVGFMVMEYVAGIPGQGMSETEGVTVIVAITGLAVLLTALNCGIFPAPLAPIPIEGLLFVHEKVAPG